MTQLDSICSKPAQDYWGVRGELLKPLYQFCADPWSCAGVMVERMEGKLLIFLLLILMFHSYACLFINIELTIVLLVCIISLLFIHMKKLWSIRHGGPRLTSSFGTCFITFMRMGLAPIGSLMTSSKNWRPTQSRRSSRQSKWRPDQAKDGLEVTHCTLEALLLLRAHGLMW